MEFAVFKGLVDVARSRNPLWFGLDSAPPAREVDVLNAERALGVSLPNAYREFVMAFGGGYFALGNVFSVAADDEWNIVEKNKSLDIPGFVAVTGNGVGDFYGYRSPDGRCEEPLWWWDHEEPSSLTLTRYVNLFDYLADTALKG